MNHLQKLREIRDLTCPEATKDTLEIVDDIYVLAQNHIEDYEDVIKYNKKRLKKFMKFCFGISLTYILLVLAMCL